MRDTGMGMFMFGLGLCALVFAWCVWLTGCTTTIEPGIEQSELCGRFQEAYERRNLELGCAPWPGACEDEGLLGCDLETVEEWADFSWALDCDQLEAHAARPQTYHGFICGDACTETGTGRETCCPGTPYELRWVCPGWCHGLSECGGDPRCEELLNGIGQ